jgi:Immunity protein 50
MTGNAIPQIDGAQEVSAFFAGWPSFHDAEVLQLALVRDGISKLVVDVATYSNETDEKGQYRRARHALVTFDLERIVDLQLEDFSMQNVLSSLSIEGTAKDVAVTLHPSYGIGGKIVCERVRVSLEPIAQSS